VKVFAAILNAAFLDRGLIMSKFIRFLQRRVSIARDRETFLPDVGQRSRATIPGDDPGDQQPSEWRGFNPDPHAIDGM
jgi:hypothetical protein